MPDPKPIPTLEERLDDIETAFRLDMEILSRRYIGKEGRLETILREFAVLPPELRAALGVKVNRLSALLRSGVAIPSEGADPLNDRMPFNGRVEGEVTVYSAQTVTDLAAQLTNDLTGVKDSHDLVVEHAERDLRERIARGNEEHAKKAQAAIDKGVPAWIAWGFATPEAYKSYFGESEEQPPAA